MKAGIPTAVATLIACLLLPAGAHALAPQESEFHFSKIGLIAFDVVILRPLGLVAVAVGSAAFVPVAVIAAPAGRDSLKTALGVLVTTPGKNVFRRPLGEF
jgi:hypothetical protein